MSFEKALFQSVLCACAMAVALPACSLLTDFDPDGKPCNTDKACKDDKYVCEIDAATNTGVCVENGTRGAAVQALSPMKNTAAFDTTSASEALPSEAKTEPPDACGERGCPAGQLCDVEAQRCVPLT